MLSLFKRKTEKEIELHARARQQEEDEKYWLKEMEKQRQRFEDAAEVAKANSDKKKQKAIQEVKAQCVIEIRKWKDKVVASNAKVAEAQSAYLIFKDWLPKALDYANMIKTGLFLKQQEATRQFGMAEGGEEGLESLQRALINKREKIEKKLGIIPED